MITLVSFIFCLQAVSAWHGYNYSHSRLDDRSECTDYTEATKPYSPDFIDKLSLWPDLMSIYDYEHGESLYGSKEALQLIWENQNPEDCSTAKFLISGGWPYGFGSRIHMEGIAMGMALHLGRIYLPHPDGDNFFFETDIEFCKKQKEPGMNCFYAPYSKCSIKDATVNDGGNVNNLHTFYMGDFRAAFDDEAGLEAMKNKLANMKGINLIQTYGGGPYDAHKYVPHQMKRIIDCSPMRQGIEYYWWRAVSATFIARPNKATLKVLAQYTTLPVLDYRDAVYMFVRHGDKGIEMKLLEFLEYVETAQVMWDQGLVPSSRKYLDEVLSSDERREEDVQRVRRSRRRSRRQLRHHRYLRTAVDALMNHTSLLEQEHEHDHDHDHEYGKQTHTRMPYKRSALAKLPSVGDWDPSLSAGDNVYGASIERVVTAEEALHLPPVPYNGTIVLTTDDPKVIDEANAWGKENHWTVVYTNLFDRAAQTAAKTWEEKNKKGTIAVHDKLEYISMLLNMYYSLRSEAYVCTMRSNSCRIVDEMRATVGGKANRYFADLSVESCPKPPCMFWTDEIVNFGE